MNIVKLGLFERVDGKETRVLSIDFDLDQWRPGFAAQVDELLSFLNASCREGFSWERADEYALL